MTQTKSELTDLNLTLQRLDTMIETGVIDKSPLTIGIDAFAFRTFAATPFSDNPSVSQEYSNAFLFLHIPLDADKRPILLHLHKKTNGSFDDSIGDIFMALKSVYLKREIPVWFKSTDGDRFLAAAHDSFFDKYVQHHRYDFQFLVETIHDALCHGGTMPIPDPLHYAKNMRGKLIDHQIAVVDNDVLVMLIEPASLQKFLDLGDVLGDHSQLGRMRDVYVTKLFTLRNVCTLIDKKEYAAAAVFLPYSCIFTLLYCTNITNETRVFLAKLAYLCFNRHLDEVRKLVRGTDKIKTRFTDKTWAITMAEPNYLKRMLHSCLSFGISLWTGPNKLRLDAMGTHLVENAIGVARSTANSTRYSAIVSAFATAELRKDIARKYDIQLRVPKRLNDGGLKVDTVADGGLTHPDSWDANDISSMFIEACNHDLMNTARAELNEFLGDFRAFTDSLQVSQLPETSDVSNALIVQRNYKFKPKK